MKLDKQVVLQILGSLMKEPATLSQVDIYNLTPDDFTCPFEKYIYGAIYNLYANGAKSISVVDVDMYLSERPAIYKVFTENNGIEYLQDAAEITDVTNFNYYYTKLKKYNALKDLKGIGIDTSSIYPEDDLFTGDKDKLIEKFEQLSVQDIFGLVKTKIAEKEVKYGCGQMEVEKANLNIHDFLRDIKQSPEIGVPLQGDIYNTVAKGGLKGKYHLFSGGSGTGKALPNSTLIPTPNGYRTVGEIRVGDYLFDALGNPTKVLDVFPQGLKDVWEVTLKSGRKAKCNDEHLWSFCTSGQREESKKKRIFSTKTLKEISKMELQNEKGTYKILIPNATAVQYKEKDHYIPSYVFGLALGDGSFRQQSSNKSFQYSSENSILPFAIGNIMNWTVKKNSSENYTWYFSSKDRTGKNVFVEDFLREHPELINTYSYDKFIPKDYLFDSIENRLDLLNGLLDSDGSIDEKGRIHYFTTSPQLRDDVVELCEGLGYTTSIHIDTHKDTNISYAILIKGRPQDKVKLFKLPRKHARIVEWYNSPKRKEQNDFDSIIKIENLNYKEEMTCFYVDNNEHLFLMNNYIVTHNTRRMVGDACHLAYPIRFNSQKGIWEKNGSCQKVMYVATEQTAREIKPMILAYLSDVNEDVIKYSMYTKDEESRLEKAMVIMDRYENNFTISRLPEPNITQVKSLFRAYALKENIEYFFYDYIFTTPSLLNEFRDIQLRNDQVLRMLSTELKNLAEELNIFVMSATQITGDSKESKGIRNEMLLRDSKSIPDKCDTAAIIARVSPEELNLLSAYLAKSPLKPTQVMDVYKNRGGRFYDVRIWSYVDLGTLRKQDLFITDPYYNEVYGFQQMTIQFQESYEDAKLIKDTVDEISDEMFNPNKKAALKLELPSPEENWDLLI